MAHSKFTAPAFYQFVSDGLHSSYLTDSIHRRWIHLTFNFMIDFLRFRVEDTRVPDTVSLFESASASCRRPNVGRLKLSVDNNRHGTILGIYFSSRLPRGVWPSGLRLPPGKCCCESRDCLIHRPARHVTRPTELKRRTPSNESSLVRSSFCIGMVRDTGTLTCRLPSLQRACT